MAGGEGASAVETATVPVLQSSLLPLKLETKGNLANNWTHFRGVWTSYKVASHLVKQLKEGRTVT